MTDKIEPVPKRARLQRASVNLKGCDAKTLAMIAAQFTARGDDEQEALRKANALYVKATAYAKRFASLSADEKAFEVDPEKVLLEPPEDLAIGDSDLTSPALSHFRRIATTKIEQNITHSAFLALLKREFHREFGSDDKLAPFALERLHASLRHARSRKRAERRKKPVNKNRTKRGL